MLNIFNDEEVYWSESANLGVLGKFEDISINLDACYFALLMEQYMEIIS